MDITVSDFMKGRYILMIYVGIDIAKLNHFAAAISSDGEILISIKSTMIIVGGYHGIRLYEREVHPHDLRRH